MHINIYTRYILHAINTRITIYVCDFGREYMVVRDVPGLWSQGSPVLLSNIPGIPVYLKVVFYLPARGVDASDGNFVFRTPWRTQLASFISSQPKYSLSGVRRKGCPALLLYILHQYQHILQRTREDPISFSPVPGMSSTLISTDSPPVQSLSRPVHDFHSSSLEDKARGGSNGGGASAANAAFAVSKLPVLGWFRDGVAVALVIIIIVNAATLVGMIYYFRTSCTSEYRVLPNQPELPVPPSLANLADQGGVTIISTSLIYFQANATSTQGGLNFWTPFQPTCGCDDCNLASCSATIPIVVEYEQCNPWGEVSR